MSPPTNQAYTVPVHSTSLSHLTRTTLPLPIPSTNQVLIRLTATSLNYRDFLIATRSASYPGHHKANLIPCSDGAGTIHSTGPSSAWAGQEGLYVFLHPNDWLTGDVRNISDASILGGRELDGTLQQWIVVGDERVVRAPQGLSSVQSAALGTAGVTAWKCIREWMDGGLFDGEVREWVGGGWDEQRLRGKTVLTLGTGGVSCFAIQIAAALGATILSTSSSSAKLALAASLGATHLINYTTHPNWDAEVLRLTNGQGVDHVIETGGAGTLMKSINSTRRGGLVSLPGLLTPNEKMDEALVPSLLFGARIVKGSYAFNRDATIEFAKFVEANRITPVIAQTFDFDQTVEAFETLQKQNSVGKICIEIQ